MEFADHTLKYQNKVRANICRDYLVNKMDSRELAEKYKFSLKAIRYILRREGAVLYADRLKFPSNNPKGRPKNPRSESATEKR